MTYFQLKFKKDVGSVVAPDGVYKKDSVHFVDQNDALPFLENGLAEIAVQTSEKAIKETRKKAVKK